MNSRHKCPICDGDGCKRCLQTGAAMWKSKDGMFHNVETMTTRHIENCVAMLKRKGFISSKTLHFYMSCPLPLGDAAMTAFEEELDRVLESNVNPWLDIFEAELEYRNSQKGT